MKSSFFARRAKKSLGRSPPQELEVSPRSGLYLLVSLTFITDSYSVVTHELPITASYVVVL